MHHCIKQNVRWYIFIHFAYLFQFADWCLHRSTGTRMLEEVRRQRLMGPLNIASATLRPKRVGTLCPRCWLLAPSVSIVFLLSLLKYVIVDTVFCIFCYCITMQLCKYLWCRVIKWNSIYIKKKGQICFFIQHLFFTCGFKKNFIIVHGTVHYSSCNGHFCRQ